MAELQEYSLDPDSSLQPLLDLYFGSLDLDLEESLREIDHDWICNEEAWFSGFISLDGGEPRTNDMLGEDKTRHAVQTTRPALTVQWVQKRSETIVQ